MIKLFKNIPKKQIVIDILCMIIWSILSVLYMQLLSHLISNFSESNPALIIVLGYFIFVIFWEVIEYLADRNQELTRVHIENNIRVIALNKTYNLKPEVIKKYNTGYINGVINRYIYHKIDLYYYIILFMPSSIIYVIYAIVTMWSFNFIYGIVLLVLIVLSLVAKLLFTPVEESKKLIEYESDRDKMMIDSISNINTIQKMQCKNFILDKLKIINNTCVTQTKVWIRKNETSFTLYKLLIYLYLPIVLLIYYFMPDTVSNKIEFFSFLSLICIQIVHMAQSLAQTLINAVKYNASLKKIKEIYADDNIRQDILNDIDFRNAQIMNLTYTYVNKENGKNITIEIPRFQLTKGDKICIYGESGQGKSTLLNILSSEIETGKVIINGIPKSKRLDCVFISQDTEILDMSLKDNLTLGKDIPDKEIIDLLYKCGLGDWYDKQPKGLDTILGERGVFVSTGQRQRLNIIRGLLVKDKEIYLLDEPTSNVDEDTEEKLIKVINDYLKNKTIVVVTHRPKIKNICTKAYKFTDSILGKEEKLFIN